MPTTIPIPIAFRLPDPVWQAVDPTSLGVTNAAFLAVRREHVGDDYAPTITVSGDTRLDDATLEQIGDEAVEVLSAQAGDVELIKRRDYGSDQAPGLLQQLDCRITTEAGELDIRQLQALLEMRDVSGGGGRVVLKVVLSTTFAQHDACLPEFQEFLRSVRVRDEAGEG